TLGTPDHAHHPSHHHHSPAHRRAANLAAQRQLGLVPQRWCRRGADHCGGAAAYRANLSSIGTKQTFIQRHHHAHVPSTDSHRDHCHHRPERICCGRGAAGIRRSHCGSPVRHHKRSAHFHR